MLLDAGAVEDALTAETALLSTLKARNVTARVLQEVAARNDEYAMKKAAYR